jgi:hypothetical protein
MRADAPRTAPAGSGFLPRRGFAPAADWVAWKAAQRSFKSQEMSMVRVGDTRRLGWPRRQHRADWTAGGSNLRTRRWRGSFAESKAWMERAEGGGSPEE